MLVSVSSLSCPLFAEYHYQLNEAQMNRLIQIEDGYQTLEKDYQALKKDYQKTQKDYQNLLKKSRRRNTGLMISVGSTCLAIGAAIGAASSFVLMGTLNNK